MARSNGTEPATSVQQEEETRKRRRIIISGSLSNAEARREYQRRYYQMHKEKAKEYQRQYNLTHKKKARIGKGKGSDAPREVIRTTFNTNDLMHSPVEKTIRMLEKIINGERFFTM